MPHGSIAVFGIAIGAETAMDQTNLPDPRLGHPFDSAGPQLDIGIDRVLDQNRNVRSPKRVGYFLYAKGVDRRPGADPQHIHIEMQRVFHLFGSSNFYSD